MKHVLRLILFLLFLALGWWLWLTLFPSPQKVIESRLVKLAKLASFSGGEGNIARVAAVERMGALFTEELQVIVNGPGMESHTFEHKSELMQAAMGARSALKGLNVKFVDIDVILSSDGQTATAELTVEATVAGQNDLLVERLRFGFQKIDRAWLIHRVEILKQPN